MSHIPDRTELGVVRLIARDLPRVRAFYETVLGLEAEEGDREVTLRAPGGPPLLVVRGNRFAPAPDPDGPGLYHTALRVPTRRDLSVVLLRLAAHRVALQGASDHLVSEALYLADPEGNGIEVYRDRPNSEWPRRQHRKPTMASIPLDLKGLADELVGDPPAPAVATRMPAGVQLGHVHLKVSELRLTERFYAGVLGFDVMARLPGALFVSAGGYHHHIGLNTWHSAGGTPAEENAAGLAWFEIRLPTRADLSDVIDRIVAAEVELERLAHGAIVRDPSGNAILLTA